MVTRTKLVNKKVGADRPSLPSNKEIIYVRHNKLGGRSSASSSAVDVIDLGAPRTLRRAAPEPLLPRPRPKTPRVYTPNPRLYPGPAAKPKRKARRAARRKRPVFRRPVPNARLYRPAPRRVPPPPAPRCVWPPPPPPAHDTASRAALRLAATRSHRRPSTPPRAPPAGPQPAAPAPPPPPRSRRLVVTLPPAAAPAPPAAMDNARHSTSPEDCSDGNDAVSAPSEFLAEFLSAIMRRQYAEALKYCRLILQYEPHNATAQGFYPLLRHKLDAHQQHESASGGSADGSSGERSSSRSHSPRLSHSTRHSHSPRHSNSPRPSPPMCRWSGASSPAEGSVSSQSSLELDSSSASASPPPPRLTPRDPNGNPAPSTTLPAADDVENDNDVSATFQESSPAGAAALRRLRAHFTCSIK